MKPILIFISAIILMSGPLLGQSNYSKGYIVNQNSDTINGYIKYQPYYHYRKDVWFKESIDIEPRQLFVIQDVKSFYIQSPNRYYEGATVNIHLKPDINNETSTNEFITDTVFLKLLVGGTIDLYEYLDNTGRQNFYMSKDSVAFIELYIKQYYHEIYDNGMPVKEIVEEDIYTDLLWKYLRDCEIIKNEIDRTDLTERSLVHIISNYNNCSSIPESGIVYVTQEKSEFNFNFSLFTGFSNAKLIFDNSTSIFDKNSTYNYFTGGLIAGVSFSDLNDNLFLNIGLSYQKNEYVNHVIQDHYFFTEDNYVDIRVDYITIPYYLKYSIVSKSRFDPYIIGGMFSSFLVSEKNYKKLIYDYVDEDSESVVSESFAISVDDGYKLVSGINNVEGGFLLGIGFNAKVSEKTNMFFEIRSIRGNGVYENSKSESLLVMLGMEF